MQERLQKLIAAAGIASRRRAEEIIKLGRVTVNGEVASLGDKADTERDDIRIDGNPIGNKEKPVYIMLNKPRGYVTTMSDEKGRRNVAELTADCGARVFPVGRLDLDSEGLLIMTNDGELANALMHPSKGCVKEYLVRVKGEDIAAKAETMAAGVELDGKRTAEAEVEVLKADEQSALLRFAIHEGRNRQIRRMCQSVELKVMRLKRVSQGGVKLGKLPSGKWRHLTAEELRQLKMQDNA